jgi:nonribosomal peptide synthetase MxcG
VVNLAPVPPTGLTDVLAFARELGFASRPESAGEWFARLRSSSDSEDLATLAFFDLHAGDEQAANLDIGTVRCDNLTRGLAGSGLECPRVGRDEIAGYLDACVARGLLPAPGRVRATG